MSINDKNGNIQLGVATSVSNASNNGSIVIGNFAEGRGRNSIAIGSANGAVCGPTKAEGDFSIAIGCGIEAGSVNGLGEIKIGNKQYNHYYYDGGTGWKIGSDTRDKINITSIPNALDFISKINPIKFRYNYRRSYSEINSILDYDKQEHEKATKAEKVFHYGVSAQEVAQALQEIYGTEKYGDIISKTVESSMQTIEECYTVNMTSFIPFLIGAINEQQEQIKTLQARIAELEVKINER